MAVDADRDEVFLGIRVSLFVEHFLWEDMVNIEFTVIFLFVASVCEAADDALAVAFECALACLRPRPLTSSPP